MTGGAAAGPARAEADQESADNERRKPGKRRQRMPACELRRHETGEIGDPKLRQIRTGRVADRDIAAAAEQIHGNEAASHQTRGEDQVPGAFATPVIAEEGRPRDAARGADVPQRRGDAELPASCQQKERHYQADQRAGQVPRPGILRGVHDGEQRLE